MIPGRQSRIAIIPKRTVVLGASPNPARYSYSAVLKLLEKGHIPFPVGLRDGEIDGISIEVGQPEIANIDTITLYIGPDHQPPLYDYILSLQPKRVIFNPGTENIELARLAQAAGILTVNACNLVMLATGEF